MKIFGLFILLVTSPFIALAANHAVILEYHHVGNDTPPSTSVSPEDFDKHLNYLEDNNFQVWPLTKVIAHLKNNLEIPDKCVVITMDDGYKSVYTEAWPRLKKRGWPLTIFVSPKFIAKNRWPYMTWDELRTLHQEGVTIANHSQKHHHLIRRKTGESLQQWQQRVESDIRVAQHNIKKEIGSVPDLFAYPFGEYNNRLRAIVKELGLVGIAQLSGPASKHSDFAAIPRFAMAMKYTKMDSFRVKVNSLPFKVISATPTELLLNYPNPKDPNAARPVMTLKIERGGFREHQFACYATGSTQPLPIEIVEKTKTTLTMKVQSHSPLPAGRSRYNCTAPRLDGKRFYWYSHGWIRRMDNRKWHPEH